jgi:hypothetical protein
MNAPTYKFSQFVDLLLVKLYRADGTHNDQFLDLEALAKEIKGDVPPSWIFDAGKVLQTRALADCIFSYGGTQAKISGEGRLYVEEERGFTKDAQNTPSNFYINITGDHSQVVAGNNPNQVTQSTTIDRGQSTLTKLLDDATKVLQLDRNVTEETRTEAMTYLEVIRQQLRKSEPNRSILAAVIEPLSKITAIAGQIATLIKYFNAAA